VSVPACVCCVCVCADLGFSSQGQAASYLALPDAAAFVEDCGLGLGLTLNPVYVPVFCVCVCPFMLCVCCVCVCADLRCSLQGQAASYLALPDAAAFVEIALCTPLRQFQVRKGYM